MTPEAKQRLIELVEYLRGGQPWQKFGALLKLNPASLLKWVAPDGGGIGAKGKQAIATYLTRNVKDIEDYLEGQYSLNDLLDPQFGLVEKLNSFNLETVSKWIRYRANLDEKLQLQQELTEQIGSIARNKATQDLHQRFQRLLDQGLTFEKIAEQAGLKQSQLEEFYRGNRLPCEDEVLALASVFGVPIEDLQKAYLAGV